MAEKKCNDQKCPVHANLKTHGRTFVGVVTSNKMQRTAVVKWEWRKSLPKYERFLTRTTKVKAHNPDCIHAKPGDIVQIKETRPISKKKNFVIIKKIGKEELFAEKVMKEEEAKITTKKKVIKEPIKEEKEE